MNARISPMPPPAAPPLAEVPLLVIRHGQTGGNGKRYVGREDVPLDPVGREQAARLPHALGDHPLDKIYCSPLGRARDTAAPLARARGLEVHVRADLQEIDYGHYQGLLKADQSLRLRHDHRFAPMPGGESLFDVYRRIGRVADELRAALLRGRRVAVVGHFWSNRMLVGILLGVPFEGLFDQMRYKPANGSVFELTFSTPGNDTAPTTPCPGRAKHPLRAVRSAWLHCPRPAGEGE